jgi:hypothetical protein
MVAIVTIFFVLRQNKQLSIKHITQQSADRWQHSDDINAWFAVKIKEWHMQEAVE